LVGGSNPSGPTNTIERLRAYQLVDLSVSARQSYGVVSLLGLPRCDL
jgi:hypothetical protein